MKVTTDACLFGAWSSEKFAGMPVHNVLDIGAGTGLLSLMVAQKLPQARIKAIELNPEAAEEASTNFRQSAFAGMLELIRDDFSAHSFVPGFFDAIICNPPFHKDQLASPGESRKLAHHETGMGLGAILQKSYEISSQNAALCILLPVYREADLRNFAAETGWHEHAKAIVFPYAGKAAFRHFWLLKKSAFPLPDPETIVIRNKNMHYTGEFTQYLKDYYLFL